MSGTHDNRKDDSMTTPNQDLKDRIVEDDGANFPVIWRATLDGFTGEIRQEEYVDDFFDPRQWSNLGTMVCWHPDYILGDFQVTNPDGRGAVKTEFQRDDFGGLDVLERYLKIALGAVVTIPLYLYDHSGISMRAGSPSPFDNPTVRRDHHGQGLGWDTTMVGYIYTTRERIVELCGEPQIETDPFYCPRTWPEDGRSGQNWPRERSAVDWIAKQLADEVQTYNDYLTGNVVSYSIESRPDGETVDSCGGFFPDHDERGDGYEYLRDEIRAELISAVEDKRKADETEANERARCANLDIATVTA